MAILRLFRHFFANSIFIFHKTDGHFDVLNRSKNRIGSKILTQNANISVFGFMQFCTKTLIYIFCAFAFCAITIVPIQI